MIAILASQTPSVSVQLIVVNNLVRFVNDAEILSPLLLPFVHRGVTLFNVLRVLVAELQLLAPLAPLVAASTCATRRTPLVAFALLATTVLAPRARALPGRFGGRLGHCSNVYSRLRKGQWEMPAWRSVLLWGRSMRVLMECHGASPRKTLKGTWQGFA